MTITWFDPKQHTKHAKKLLKARDMPIEHAKSLPQTGRIAIVNGNPIAIGFIRSIEGNFAMLDSFITNPDVDSLIRHQALDSIIAELLSFCQESGKYKVLAFTSDSGIKDRAIAHGMSELADFTTYSITLNHFID